MVSRLRVDELTAPNGLSAPSAPYGLKLPNSSIPGSTTFDWYEKGTWTPAFTAQTPGTISFVTTVSWATFTRVGRLVTASFRCSVASGTIGTASGNLRISGLPYASSAEGGGVGSCFTTGVDLFGGNVVIWLSPGNSFIEFYSSVDNGTWGAAAIGGLSISDEIIGTITYPA